MSRPRSPFDDVRPGVVVALVYTAAIVVWLVAGSRLPGGRWLVVHLFTLGVVTNLVAALTMHFAVTLSNHPGRPRHAARLVTLNAGALAVLIGVPSRQVWLLATGATVATAAVFWLYRELRTVRKQALNQRFAFVVRTYERACGAFLHGAVLGALLGLGVLDAGWYTGVRLAHLHTNVLGWGGLTFLGTVVLFGPTVLRTRMEPDADAAAARALRYGATALAIGVLALIASGVAGVPGTAARLLAAVGLAGYAVAATAVCIPVLRAARRARGNANGWLLAAACVSLPVVVAADVVVVATGRWWALAALGAVALIGVLGQAIAGAVGYLTPMLFAAGDRRARWRHRLEAGAAVRTALFNLGVVGIAATGLGAPGAAGRTGLVLLVLALAAPLVLPSKRG